MKILGISAFYHDSAASIVDNGEIVAAAQEERFTRIKHDSSFPSKAVSYCLREAGFEIDELDAIVFYDKPLLKFERLLETYYSFAPKGISSFIAAIPVWINEKLFLKSLIKDKLYKIEAYDKKKINLLFSEHHLSHQASAFYPSPFEESAILTIDGVGEWATASIGYGQGNQISILKELHFPHSPGLLYSAFTYFLGFRVNSGEYKLMGAAPYGIPESDEVVSFIQLIKNKLVTIKDDGSIWLNQSYFRYPTGLRMIPDKRWAKLFGFSRRKTDEELNQSHCNLALAIQKVIEEIVLKMASEAKRLTASSNLTMAGGVALNCVANGVLLRSGLFDDIFIQPAAGDAGGALGAALAGHYINFGNQRIVLPEQDSMKGSYLGPAFSEKEIVKVIRKYKAVAKKIETPEILCDKVADYISQEKVVGWFQGRMEFGPRALGNRSILGDARSEGTQMKLNLKIKYRESFRPFAPSVLAEDAALFFNLNKPSPYMLLVAQVQEKLHKTVPQNYYKLELRDRLYTKRSDIPAITHIDFSARVQTVDAKTNNIYHTLLQKMKVKTGMGILVNTSFNVRGEPIVCTPEDAFRCFMRTEMDYLVIDNFLFKKSDQPNFEDRENWKETFKLD